MAQIEGGFNPSEHGEMRGMLDPGDYLCMIVESELKRTNDGTGKYIALTFEIIDGPCKSRRFYRNINRVNKSDIAVKIGNEELATICRALKKVNITDTQALHNLPLVATLGLKKRKDGEVEQVAKNYKSKDDAASQVATASGSMSPWKMGAAASMATSA